MITMSNPIEEEIKQNMLTEFIHGVLDESGVRRYPSIDALSRNHDVSRASLYRVAKSENWQAQKNDYQTELQSQINKDRMSKAATEAKRLDDTCVQLSMAMLTVVGKSLQEFMQSDRVITEAADASVLGNLSNVAGNAQKIGKLALGEAQEISKVSANVSTPDAFRAVMDQLDELASTRAQKFGGSVH